jgi:hypothetical protein
MSGFEPKLKMIQIAFENGFEIRFGIKEKKKGIFFPSPTLYPSGPWPNQPACFSSLPSARSSFSSLPSSLFSLGLAQFGLGNHCRGPPSPLPLTPRARMSASSPASRVTRG